MIDTAASQSRLHYMDAMRSVLMLLGVVLHSARPYGSGNWRVHDVDRHAVFDGLTWLLHLFRMPAFFVVAGYFTMLLLCRRTTGVFLRERLRRVGVPLLATLLSVNVIQSWYLGRSRATGFDSFLEGVLLPDLWSGKLTGHLWFLVCLAVYFLIAALLAPVLRRLARPATQAPSVRTTTIVFHLMLVIAILAPLALAVVAKVTAPLLSGVVFGLTSPMQVLRHLPFFAVGIALCARPGMLDRFASHDGVVIILGLCGALGVYLTAGHEGLAHRSVHIVSLSLLAWMAVRVVFSLFRRWADAPSSTFRYLSDASYSIYLFHHLAVVVAASLLLPVEADAWMKFAIVLTTASAVSLAAHHFLIRRYAVLGFLFNGKAFGSRRRKYSVEPELARSTGT